VYGNETAALSAQATDIDNASYAAWLAANVGVNYYPTFGSAHAGKYAYNSTEYASRVEAEAARDEADYQAWLAANVGVSYYNNAPGTARYGQWAYNQTEYASEIDAQAAYNAANPQ
jgi:ligand-binding sensor domain-containing protein